MSQMMLSGTTYPGEKLDHISQLMTLLRAGDVFPNAVQKLILVSNFIRLGLPRAWNLHSE